MDDPERRTAVRPLTVDDLDAVAAIHTAAFPESALARLGTEALRRSYRWQLEGPHDVVALAAHDRGRLVGFLVGGTFSGSLVGFVRRERWFLARQVLRRPSLALRSVGRDRLALAARLLLRRSTRKHRGAPAAAAPAGRSFGVLAIAVDPAAEGTGVGRSLMAAARRAAEARGYRRMHLNVHPGNGRAIAFYERLGFRDEREGGADGRDERHMTLSLRSGGPTREPG